MADSIEQVKARIARLKEEAETASLAGTTCERGRLPLRRAATWMKR